MSTWLKVFTAGLILIAVSLAIVFVAACVNLFFLEIVGAVGAGIGLTTSCTAIMIIDDDKED